MAKEMDSAQILRHLEEDMGDYISMRRSQDWSVLFHFIIIVLLVKEHRL